MERGEGNGRGGREGKLHGMERFSRPIPPPSWLTVIITLKKRYFFIFIKTCLMLKITAANSNAQPPQITRQELSNEEN